ncbi:MAG: GNAT family N-acetyltransferase [Acidobacteriota bacterium]|nr:GNAT family N-acetyltransferase [Acidobacteriota bacterium]
MNERIQLAETGDEIMSCYAVMAELRPHIAREEFLPRVKKQTEINGFRLAYLTDGGEVKAVAGIRISEWLGGGKYMEIEDLATMSGERSKGYGGELFDWLVEYAKKENCNQIKLVSHVKRFAAHKFYLNKGMIIEAHYFSMKL